VYRRANSKGSNQVPINRRAQVLKRVPVFLPSRPTTVSPWRINCPMSRPAFVPHCILGALLTAEKPRLQCTAQLCRTRRMLNFFDVFRLSA
jgi:hypothetical protein